MPSRETGTGAVEEVAADNPAKETTVLEHRGGLRTQFAGLRLRIDASVAKRRATVPTSAPLIDQQ